MEELKKYYDAKISELDALHKAWVKSNWNLNGLYEAKTQIHDVGDIKIAFAAEALEKATKEEKSRNDDLTYRVNALSGFLRDMERYIKDTFGEELNGVELVRGY